MAFQLRNVAVITCLVFLSLVTSSIMLHQRTTSLRAMEDRLVQFEWCKPNALEQFTEPETSDQPAYRLQFRPGSGACSVLIGILDAAMHAATLKRPFFLDERKSRLCGNYSSWYNRYFQPIGQQGRNPEQQPFVDMFYEKQVLNFSRRENITIQGETLPKIQMKQRFLRRFWQFQPWVQEKICPMLQELKLRHPYISLLVRRGDKQLEKRKPIPISAVLELLNTVTWNGIVTTDVFVGTDDCRAIEELKAAAGPRFVFKNLCHIQFGLGWVLEESVREDLTEHYLKFFGELIAMASADIFLGDSGSNVHHWVAYMRSEDSGNFTVYDLRTRELFGRIM